MSTEQITPQMSFISSSQPLTTLAQSLCSLPNTPAFISSALAGNASSAFVVGGNIYLYGDVAVEAQRVCLEDGSIVLISGRGELASGSDEAAPTASDSYQGPTNVDSQSSLREESTEEGLTFVLTDDGRLEASSVCDGYLTQNLYQAALEPRDARPLKIDLGIRDASVSSTKATAQAPSSLSRENEGHQSLKCADCGHLSKSSGAATLHRRTHTKERPFKCPYDACEKAFRTSGDLIIHKRVHTGEKPYHCSFDGCGSSFKTNGQLSIHQRRHTGERPFECVYPGCTKSFAKRYNLTNHIRVHTGEKPFTCKDCGRTFAECSSLRKHSNWHSSVKPHQCSFCVRRFGQTSSLRYHVRTVHGVDGTSCEVDNNALPDAVLAASRGNESIIDATEHRVHVVRMDQQPLSGSLTCLSHSHEEM